MRKLFLFAVILPCAFIAACTNGGGGEKENIEGSLTEILEKIYDNLDPSVDVSGTFEEKLTQEGTEFNPNIEYFIGTDNIPFTEGIVSEPAVGGAYSLVLLRMEPGADIESAKREIADNVDPWKWICMGVDPNDVIVDNIGDIVVLIMSDHSKKLHDAFLTLAV